MSYLRYADEVAPRSGGQDNERTADVEHLSGRCRLLAHQVRRRLGEPGRLKASDRNLLTAVAEQLEALAVDITLAYNRGEPEEVRERAGWVMPTCAVLAAVTASFSAVKDARDWWFADDVDQADHTTVIEIVSPATARLALETIECARLVISLPDNALRPHPAPIVGRLDVTLGDVTVEGGTGEVKVEGISGEFRTEDATASATIEAHPATATGQAHDATVRVVENPDGAVRVEPDSANRPPNDPNLDVHDLTSPSSLGPQTIEMPYIQSRAEVFPSSVQAEGSADGG